MSQFNQPLGGNEMPRFGGPATMMRLPSASSPKGLDAAFIGIPMDHGTSNRPGTRLGPRQIRDESRMLRPYNMATGAAPFEHLQVADLGDGLGYLGMLTVDPERQAGGLGRELLEAGEAWARDRFGARAMEMTVIARRRELIAWYERRGYALTGETRPFPMDDPRFGLPREPWFFVVLRKRL